MLGAFSSALLWLPAHFASRGAAEALDACRRNSSIARFGFEGPGEEGISVREGKVSFS